MDIFCHAEQSPLHINIKFLYILWRDSYYEDYFYGIKVTYRRGPKGFYSWGMTSLSRITIILQV